MRDKSNKWSIQISRDLYDCLRTYCKDRGYKISGLVEQSIKQTITGSILAENKKIMDLLNKI